MSLIDPVSLPLPDLKASTEPSTDSSYYNSTDSESSVSLEQSKMAHGCFNVTLFKEDLLIALNLKKVKRLGKGLSGDVILTRCKTTGKALAIKRFDLDSDSKTSKAMLLVKEVTLTNKLTHPHTIRNLVPVQCPYYAAICMEFFPHGSLKRYIKKLDITPSQVDLFFDQLASAVQYMHKKKIIHRDIKLDNILVKAEDFIVLADFGLGEKVSSGEKLTGAVGTYSFMAPEVRSFNDHKKPYDGRLADSYSCGVVLWSMMMEMSPPEDAFLVEAIYLSSDVLEPHLMTVALNLLQDDPQDRKTVTDIVDTFPELCV